VHKNTYARWEREEREIDASTLARLALRGVDANWLLTGHGSARIGAESHLTRLDAAKLALAIETVDEALAATGRTADTTVKSQLVAKVYELFLSEGTDASKATAAILRLVRTGT
jgi:transcriptional regulator with XRE-family HTH domain